MNPDPIAPVAPAPEARGPLQDLHTLQQRDLSSLRHLLQHSFLNFPEPRPDPAPGQPLSILNLACGSCCEAETLAEFFSRPRENGASNLEFPGRPTRLVGLDIRRREISDAASRTRDYLARKTRGEGRSAASLLNFEFLAADASKTGSHQSLDENFDVVFLRHQNFYDNAAVWREIFREGLAKLAPEGNLILTSYFDREHHLALKAIAELGGEIVLTSENTSARALSTPGKSVDRHIAIVRKRDATG